eukprot:m.158492 g.158492  ORF g.158492 m.158492 type:complete len:948 (-) comp13353_c1_seq3:28-2871(-)
MTSDFGFVEIPVDEIKFLECIGAGQFGEVYRANWKGKEVAVKKTLCFDVEARVLASLRHKNIIGFHGACTQVPNSFLVTEYAQEGSLYSLLEGMEELDVNVIVKWLLDIANGVQYLHHDAPVNMIHRDLKSLNVLVCDIPERFLLKICDFGSSKQLSSQTQSFANAGTVSWMAPEVIQNQHVTEKCDVWSFGVIVWEIVTLEVPYENMEPFSILWLVAKQNMRLPIPSTCPESLKNLMCTCMSTDPASRPAFTAIVRQLLEMDEDEELFDDLKTFLTDKNKWVNELDKVMKAFSDLEADANKLANERRILEQKENELKLRERALIEQRHSTSFVNNNVPNPDTAFEHAIRSQFSTTVEAQHWSVAEVAAWLSVLPDVDVYTDVFRENEISGKVLLSLTDDILQNALGIKPFGHRYLLLDHIKNIQRSTDFPPLFAPVEELSDAAVPESFKVELKWTYSWKEVVGKKKSHRFEFKLQSVNPEYDSYIKNVEYIVASRRFTSTNPIEICNKAPFVTSGTYRKKAPTLNIKIYFRGPQFRRKTHKESFVLNKQFPKSGVIEVQLKSRQANIKLKRGNETISGSVHHTKDVALSPREPSTPSTPSKINLFNAWNKRKGVKERYTMSSTSTAYEYTATEPCESEEKDVPSIITDFPEDERDVDDFVLRGTSTRESSYLFDEKMMMLKLEKSASLSHESSALSMDQTSVTHRSMIEFAASELQTSVSKEVEVIDTHSRTSSTSTAILPQVVAQDTDDKMTVIKDGILHARNTDADTTHWSSGVGDENGTKPKRDEEVESANVNNSSSGNNKSSNNGGKNSTSQYVVLPNLSTFNIAMSDCAVDRDDESVYSISNSVFSSGSGTPTSLRSRSSSHSRPSRPNSSMSYKAVAAQKRPMKKQNKKVGQGVGGTNKKGSSKTSPTKHHHQGQGQGQGQRQRQRQLHCQMPLLFHQHP